MPSLVGALISLDHFLMYPNFAISAMLVYLTVRVVPRSLSRIYCSNLGIPILFYNACNVTLEQLYIYERRASSFRKALIITIEFVREFTLYDYLYFSTLTILLAYIAYANPVLFKKVARRSTMIILSSFGHTFAAVSVPIFSPTYPIPVSALGISETKLFSIAMIAQLLIIFTFYIAMLLLYVLAVIEMRKNIAMFGATSSITLAHKKMLKSILLYCSPPNVFAVLAFPTCLLHTWQNMVGVWHITITSRQWLDIVHSVAHLLMTLQEIWITTENVRIFVTVFTALIAFHDYRTAVKNAFLTTAAWPTQPLITKKRTRSGQRRDAGVHRPRRQRQAAAAAQGLRAPRHPAHPRARRIRDRQADQQSHVRGLGLPDVAVFVPVPVAAAVDVQDIVVAPAKALVLAQEATISFQPAEPRHRLAAVAVHRLPNAPGLLRRSAVEDAVLHRRSGALQDPSPPSPHRRRLPPSPPPLTRIYISNLTKHLTKAHVEEIFGKFGTVKRCELPPKTHHEYFNRGRALLEFEKAEEAIKAQRYMDGGQIDGLRVKVILSHQSPNRQYAQYPVRRSHGSPSRRRSPPSKHGSPPRSCRDGMNRGRRYSRSRSPPRRPDGHRL